MLHIAARKSSSDVTKKKFVSGVPAVWDGCDTRSDGNSLMAEMDESTMRCEALLCMSDGGESWVEME